MPHLKAAKDEKKKSTMVSDHLLINRKKFILDEGNNLQQKAQEVGWPVNEKNQCTVKGDYIAKGNTKTQDTGHLDGKWCLVHVLTVL